MKHFILVLAVAAVAVAIMVLGLAITRIRKGRDLQSDVGSNDDMTRLGLTCTSKAIKQEERELRGEDSSIGCDDDCGSCSGHHK